ncbi:MAG: hypothetical protein FJ037_05665 [Chloroflexi bacterium]|nr:hypothetical protein [Chloroflexota bacterium]
MNDLEREVVEEMTARGLTLGTAESTVGGLIGHLLTDVPGSSKVFVGGITAYHGRPKTTLLNVPVDTLRNAGPSPRRQRWRWPVGVARRSRWTSASPRAASPAPAATRSGLAVCTGSRCRAREGSVPSDTSSPATVRPPNWPRPRTPSGSSWKPSTTAEAPLVRRPRSA